jgi:hypothetical protein
LTVNVQKYKKRSILIPCTQYIHNILYRTFDLFKRHGKRKAIFIYGSKEDELELNPADISLTYYNQSFGSGSRRSKKATRNEKNLAK